MDGTTGVCIACNAADVEVNNDQKCVDCAPEVNADPAGESAPEVPGAEEEM